MIAAGSHAVIWHDVECGAYAADLELWRGLAASLPSPSAVLEVGCGTGRVALDLARAGHAVEGIDTAPELVHELNRRAQQEALAARASVRDVRELDAARRYRLGLAPMQVLQLLPDAGARAAALARLAGALAPAGRLAVALVEPESLPEEALGAAALPDVAEREGSVFSSLPLDLSRRDGYVQVRRLRQVVTPGGELHEEVDVTRLAIVSADALLGEAASAGLRLIERHTVPATQAHVESTVLVLGGRP